MPSLVTLSDVMGTGHHAARAARVGAGKIAAVVGDGAVGLCGVIAARRLGAEQVIILGRRADRISLAREFGSSRVASSTGSSASTTCPTGDERPRGDQGHGEAMTTRQKKAPRGASFDSGGRI